MGGKIALYKGQNIEFSNNIVSIISFKDTSFLENRSTIILVVMIRNYLRTYLNFKESPEVWQFLFLKYFIKNGSIINFLCIDWGGLKLSQ